MAEKRPQFYLKCSNDNNKNPDETQFLFFKADDGAVNVNVRLEGETVWLTQAAMAELFDCSTDNVSLHLKNIYETGELQPKATTEDFSVVRQEGNREVSRLIKHYNLDAIIAVGYRVNSKRATQFRIWATSVLFAACNSSISASG